MGTHPLAPVLPRPFLPAAVLAILLALAPWPGPTYLEWVPVSMRDIAGVVLLIAAHRAITPPHARRIHYVTFAVLTVAIVVAGVLHPLPGGWVALTGLGVAAVGEEGVWRIAIPVITYLALDRFSTWPPVANLTVAYLFALAWFTVLPGHLQQAEGYPAALGGIALAGLMFTWFTWRVRAPLIAGITHLASNQLTFLYLADEISAERRWGLLAALWLIALAGVGAAHGDLAEHPRSTRAAGEWQSDEADGTGGENGELWPEAR